MKYIFLNLKRFDITTENNGINKLSVPNKWGKAISTEISKLFDIKKIKIDGYTFPIFLPEAHIISAKSALEDFPTSPIQIGCQSVHFSDVSKGGNFGAFTTLRPASSMKQLGCQWTLIGHSEERAYLVQVIKESGCTDAKVFETVHKILNKKIACALQAGLKIAYCIGEKSEEVSNRKEVIKQQIELGLGEFKTSNDIVLAYEPIWAIGPGKTPPTAEEIRDIACQIKKMANLPLVYGGGLKKENAEAIGQIKELDGGLIALTRFSGEIGFYPDEYIEIISLYYAGTQKA